MQNKVEFILGDSLSRLPKRTHLHPPGLCNTVLASHHTSIIPCCQSCRIPVKKGHLKRHNDSSIILFHCTVCIFYMMTETTFVRGWQEEISEMYRLRWHRRSSQWLYKCARCLQLANCFFESFGWTVWRPMAVSQIAIMAMDFEYCFQWDWSSWECRALRQHHVKIIPASIP